jgi:hypothetical protein
MEFRKKGTMKIVRCFIVGTIITSSSLVAGLNLLHAQTAVVGSFNNGFAPVQSATPDSIVQLTADAQGLTQIAPANLPRTGTYWLVLPSGFPAPAPCPPLDPGVPVYQMASGQFLVDETGGQVAVNPRRFGMQAQATGGTAVSGLETEAATVLNLIERVQTTAANEQMRTMSRAMDMNVPSPGGDGGGNGGGGTSGFYSDSFNYTLPTNGLFLTLTNVSNGYAWLNLHNATNLVYEVLSKTDLSDAGWNIETEVWPTDTNSTAFTVPELGRTNLFIWAQDWTGVTENGNTTPDWWFWEYFGTTILSDTNLDSQGNTLLSDYQNGVDPNVITFSIEATNNYVNTSYPSLQLNIIAGTPSYYAVLVDSTNFATTNWTAYTSSSVMANLGSQEGWHDIWIGLRGLPSNAQQSWQWKRLKLDLTPPQITMTSPTPGVVTLPTIQVQGFSPEKLESVSCDVSNATGLTTNLSAGVTDQCYDTNTWEFTTNYFECLDVPLTNGVNQLIVHATDLAGNVTTTNFSFTLDYSSKTNPPEVQIIWPQNGTQVSGSSFTLDGQLADPTATVSVFLTDTNGNTNTVVGLVERNGRFWVENLPLSGGTNMLALTVIDAVGNTSVTNISVIQSALVLAMDPVSDPSQLWQPTINLTGTIGDTTQAVWVNGVKGHNNGDGTWSANNVPTTTGGVASFTITAYATNEQQPDGSYGN